MSRSHDPREAHFPQTASLLPRAATAPARVNSVHRSRHSSSGCRRGDPARRARARVRQRHRSAREGEPGARSQLRSARPWDDFSPRASVERALSRLVTACVGAPWSRRPREVNGGGHRPRPTRRSISAAVVTLIACSEPSTSSRALTMRSSMRARSTARASPRASIRRPAQARPSGGAVLLLALAAAAGSPSPPRQLGRREGRPGPSAPDAARRVRLRAVRRAPPSGRRSDPWSAAPAPIRRRSPAPRQGPTEVRGAAEPRQPLATEQQAPLRGRDVPESGQFGVR